MLSAAAACLNPSLAAAAAPELSPAAAPAAADPPPAAADAAKDANACSMGTLAPTNAVIIATAKITEHNCSNYLLQYSCYFSLINVIVFCVFTIRESYE